MNDFDDDFKEVLDEMIANGEVELLVDEDGEFRLKLPEQLMVRAEPRVALRFYPEGFLF